MPETTMPFGLFQGKLLTALPLDYMRWAIRTWKPCPLVDAMVEVVKGRASATKSTIYLSLGKKTPSKTPTVKEVLTTRTYTTCGEPFGKLKELLDNAPKDLF